jgi:hypothetical protein
MKISFEERQLHSLLLHCPYRSAYLSSRITISKGSTSKRPTTIYLIPKRRLNPESARYNSTKSLCHRSLGSSGYPSIFPDLERVNDVLQ